MRPSVHFKNIAVVVSFTCTAGLCVVKKEAKTPKQQRKPEKACALAGYGRNDRQIVTQFYHVFTIL